MQRDEVVHDGCRRLRTAVVRERLRLVLVPSGPYVPFAIACPPPCEPACQTAKRAVSFSEYGAPASATLAVGSRPQPLRIMAVSSMIETDERHTVHHRIRRHLQTDSTWAVTSGTKPAQRQSQTGLTVRTPRVVVFRVTPRVPFGRILSMLGETVQCRPVEVIVGDRGLDRAIKNLKRKMANEGILRELKNRRHYMKPSIKRRKKEAEAGRRRRKRARQILLGE